VGLDVQDRRKDLVGLSALQTVEVFFYRARTRRSSVEANPHRSHITLVLLSDKERSGSCYTFATWSQPVETMRQKSGGGGNRILKTEHQGVPTGDASQTISDACGPQDDTSNQGSATPCSTEVRNPSVALSPNGSVISGLLNDLRLRWQQDGNVKSLRRSLLDVLRRLEEEANAER
jgi:hypothetical protein